MRDSTITRNTLETQISARFNLDGTGQSKLNTGVPFLDHMLDQIARHGLMDIEVSAKAICTSTRTTRWKTSASRWDRRSPKIGRAHV